jgi:hypothetical protein
MNRAQPSRRAELLGGLITSTAPSPAAFDDDIDGCVGLEERHEDARSLFAVVEVAATAAGLS